MQVITTKISQIINAFTGYVVVLCANLSFSVSVRSEYKVAIYGLSEMNTKLCVHGSCLDSAHLSALTGGFMSVINPTDPETRMYCAMIKPLQTLAADFTVRVNFVSGAGGAPSPF